MNNNDMTRQDANQADLNRCNCPKCQGRAGTARVCLNNRKLAARARDNATVKTAGLFLLLACFILPGQATAGEENAFGFLQVYSSTQESQWGEGSFYYPHTGYRIYDSTGTMLRWVENHGSSTDEVPEKVELAPGAYTIWAQSDRDGYVKRPVTIKEYRTTTVRLEKVAGGKP